LFSAEGVVGIVNVDVTPETATRLAMAYGTTLARGQRIVASRDVHPASRMIKRAMIAGLISTGISVEDLRVAPSAINRFEVKNTVAAGGLHVQVSDQDPEMIQITFLEENGILATDRTKKDIEKYYERQEVRRALLNQLGELAFPPRVTESYVEGLLRKVDVERIREKRFRIAVDYAFSSAALVLPQLLRMLRVESFYTHSFMDPDEEAIRTADMPAFTSHTRRLVEAMGADLGVVLDRAGERILLIDERARELPADVTLHLLLHLISRHPPAGGGRVVLPANVSAVAERIVQEGGLEIERGRITSAGLMEAAVREDVVFAGSPDGGFIFPEFIPGFDAAMSLAKVLELLALERKPLSELHEELPRAALIHERAPVPWSFKGMVMRELSERLKENRVDLADGIRVEEDGGWAQLVPDPDEPFLHIYAEGSTNADSARIARRYRELLEDVLARGAPSSSG
jgi:mannose-1-phosphate guanylyltransferase / phosphomannomutase